MRRLASSLLIVGAFALGACGGDSNDENASNGTATTGTTESTTTQSTTGTTTGGKGGGKKSGSGKSGSKGGKGKSGGSDDSSTSTGGGTTSTKAPTTPSQGTTPSPGVVNPRKAARTVCGSFLPEPISRQIKSGKVTKEKVARQYSKGYPADQRKAAYKGCLEGLNKRHY